MILSLEQKQAAAKALAADKIYFIVHVDIEGRVRTHFQATEPEAINGSYVFEYVLNERP